MINYTGVIPPAGPAKIILDTWNVYDCMHTKNPKTSTSHNKKLEYKSQGIDGGQ